MNEKTAICIVQDFARDCYIDGDDGENPFAQIEGWYCEAMDAEDEDVISALEYLGLNKAAVVFAESIDFHKAEDETNGE